MPASTFDSPFISDCQPMPSGNVLICGGRSGGLFEVIRDGEIVRIYNFPYNSDIKLYENGRSIFRCYRYEEYSPEILGRLGGPV